MVNITKFQIVFSSYLAQFFELNLHIWYLGSYLNMFLEKIKVFVKILFFVVRGRFWIKNPVICYTQTPRPGSLFSRIEWSLWQNRSISASFRSWASLRMFRTSEGRPELTSLKFWACYEVFRCSKTAVPFFFPLMRLVTPSPGEILW